MQLESTMVAAIETLTAAADSMDEGTTGEVARRLDYALQLKMVAQQIIDVTTESLTDRMEEPTLAVAGVGLFHRKASQRSVWRDPDAGKRFRSDVFRSIVDLAAVDRATGERSVEAQAGAQRAVAFADEALPSFTTLLKSGQSLLDIDVSEYRRVEWTNTIKVERGIQVTP